MSIEKVIRFMTRDGAEHLSREVADHHEIKLKIRDALENDPLLGNYCGSRVTYESLLTWIEDHPDLLVQFLESLGHVE